MIYRRKGDMGIWPLFNKTGNRDSAKADRYGNRDFEESRPKGPLPPLEDADYLLLFNQILEGLRLGWERQDVVKYLEALGDRGNFALWGAWLQRFGETKLKKNTQNMDLGRRLAKLGQLNCGEFSNVAHHLGSQLLSQRATTSPFSSQPEAASSPVSQPKETTGTEAGQGSWTSPPTEEEAGIDRSEAETSEDMTPENLTPENLTPENLEVVQSLFEEGNQKFQAGDFAGDRCLSTVVKAKARFY
jgi:hypothetical protein